MADLRNRVSITLTDPEKAQVDGLAHILGIKPTRVVYEALKEGMPLILAKGQKLTNDMALARQLREWSQTDWDSSEKISVKKKKK